MFQRLMKACIAPIFVAALSASAFAGVTVNSPANGATVSSPMHVVASASSGAPVTAMRVYVDGTSQYLGYTSKIDTYIPASAGWHSVVVQAWDSTGAVMKAPLNINVSGTSATPAPTTANGVTISSPTNGSTVGSPVHFVASAAASNPISAMRIYVDSNSVYTVSGNKIDTSVAIGGGTHNVVVQAWDIYGGVYKASETVVVNGTASSDTGGSTAPSGAKTFTNIEQMSGWENCDACSGPGATGAKIPYTMTQGVSNPSMDGNAAGFWVGGSSPWASAIWWKQLGANDNVSHFTYDLYFYVKDLKAPFALEFDTNQTTGGLRYVMGTQCGINYDHQWDVWDSANKHWVQTGIPCTNVQAYTWNHLTEEYYRANGKIYYVSITLNGQKYYVNRSFNAIPIANSRDINVAFQMDMNGSATNYNAWLDQVKLTYW